MSEQQVPDNGLFACTQNGQCCLQLNGRGSFKISTVMKKYITRAVEEENASLVRIDMLNCIGMDSTFMGVVAGLSGRLKKKGVQTILINLDEKNANLLKTLGIDHVVQFSMIDGSDNSCACAKKGVDTELLGLTETQQETASTMLTAHQTLTDLNDENIDRFKNVINLLEEDLKKFED